MEKFVYLLQLGEADQMGVQTEHLTKKKGLSSFFEQTANVPIHESFYQREAVAPRTTVHLYRISKGT